MDKYMKAIDELISSVSRVVKSAIEENNKSRTYVMTARVISIESNERFIVQIQEKNYTVKSHFNHNVGDFVRVLVENGNLSEMTIIY